MSLGRVSSEEFTTVYKSSDLWVINKRNRTHFDEVLPQKERIPWFPVHRLDFETSGLQLFAKKERAESIRLFFKNPQSGLKKIYLAGASKELLGKFPLRVEGYIASRYRSSKKTVFLEDEQRLKNYRSHQHIQHVVKKYEGENFLKFRGFVYELQLLTGARHQIRSYFAAQGASLQGDPLYGASTKLQERLELHSWRLLLPAGLAGNEPLELCAQEAL